MTPCEELSEEFPELAAFFQERERLGMERYGAPLVDDGRDFDREAAEEIGDAMVYITAAIRRLDPLKRSSSDARHRWLTLRNVRRRLRLDLLDLVKP
tara:strand:+ start:112 stop:402 length:291 start_codon:yes stop_codon:yes gene_type:complete